MVALRSNKWTQRAQVQILSRHHSFKRLKMNDPITVLPCDDVWLSEGIDANPTNPVGPGPSD